MPTVPISDRAFSRYSLTVASAGVCALAAALWGQQWETDERLLNGVTALLVLALATEVTAVKWQVGSASFSMAFIPLLAAVFLFPSIWGMLIGGTTQFVVSSVVRKKPWTKTVFNTSKEVLAVGAASAAYHLLGGEPSTTEFQFLLVAVLGTGIVYSLVDSVLVGHAVSVLEGLEFGDTWSRMYGGTIVYDFFASPVPALLAYLYVWRELLGVVILTAPLFVIRHIYLQNLRLEQRNRELLELMVKNIEARDPYTSGHSQRVSQYARVIAKELGLSGKQVDNVATAGLLHDVGKTYEEFGPLLRKEGKLTGEERKLLQSHPVRSADLVATISSFRGPVEQAVRHHHENYDGSGYPNGLVGEQIPMGARIIMMADTLDAMTTDRPYRIALAFERAIEEMRRFSGTQFDPHLVDIVVRSTALRRLATADARSIATSARWASPTRTHVIRA